MADAVVDADADAWADADAEADAGVVARNAPCADDEVRMITRGQDDSQCEAEGHGAISNSRMTRIIKAKVDLDMWRTPTSDADLDANLDARFL